ncbi:MAG TPA: hypothetical protein VJS64_19695 [Pyrinomonadaceae bacterium]|nr:hypothetical protein [Pyrinomonadaceae bacterium]
MLWNNAATRAQKLPKSGFSCSTVIVPLDTKKASLNSVKAQAAVARAFCEANSGSARAGYFVIGDGAIIGKKQ